MKPAPRDALLIEGLGVKPGPEDEPDAVDSPDDESDESDSFAADAFDALKNDDAEAFKTALRGMVESCMGSY